MVCATSSEAVKKMINELDQKFDELKDAIRECLERHKISVSKVADVLTSVSVDYDNEHKLFLESHISTFYKADTHFELFGTIKSHLNYLDPSLLDLLVIKLKLMEVKVQMEAYKSDLQQFRMKTPLASFCKTRKGKRIEIPPEFEVVAAEFAWPNDDDVTLEVVEKFRQEYASHFNLRQSAMMLAEILRGSYIITWFIPKSLVEKMKGEIPKAILKEFYVTKLKIAGICVYHCHKTEEVIGS